MNISARTNYACRAVLELSMHWPAETPLPINEIAKRQNIPLKFLTQILIQLKSYGFVQSIRGKSGGYLLAKDPSEVTLYDIVAHFDADILTAKNENKEKDVICHVWSRLEEQLNEGLKQYTFDSLAQKQKLNNDVVMFQI